MRMIAPANIFDLALDGRRVLVMYDRQTDTVTCNNGFQTSGANYWRILMDNQRIGEEFSDLLEWICDKRKMNVTPDMLAKIMG